MYSKDRRDPYDVMLYIAQRNGDVVFLSVTFKQVFFFFSCRSPKIRLLNTSRSILKMIKGSKLKTCETEKTLQALLKTFDLKRRENCRLYS